MKKFSIFLASMFIIGTCSYPLWAPNDMNTREGDEKPGHSTAIVLYDPKFAEEQQQREKVKQEAAKKDVTTPQTKNVPFIEKDSSKSKKSPKAKATESVLLTFMKSINMDEFVKDIDGTHKKRVAKTKALEEERIANGQKLTIVTKVIDRVFPSINEGTKFVGRRVLVPLGKAVVENAGTVVPVLVDILLV